MESLAPLGLDPWTVQPVASHCADCFPSPPAAAPVLFELMLCDSALGNTLSISGVMAVLHVLVIFYIYSDHKP